MNSPCKSLFIPLFVFHVKAIDITSKRSVAQIWKKV